MALSQHIIKQLISPDGGEFAVSSLDEAYTFCKNQANQHYENFPVGSLLVGKHRAHHIHAIYVFARLADDISDELQVSATEKLDLLACLQKQLTSPTKSHPVFLALQNTIKKLDIPTSPFEKLLHAFSLDSNFTQPTTWDDVLYYCSHSANPIGELVLRVFQEYNHTNAQYSDAICTALQLTNFWQDFSRDLPNKRIYIPVSVLETNNLPEESLFNQQFYTKFPTETELVLQNIYHYTYRLFSDGSKLLKHVDSLRLKTEIAATLSGGLLILNKSEKSGLNIFSERPVLSSYNTLQVLTHTLLKVIGINNIT